jgi:hypothetical protein
VPVLGWYQLLNIHSLLRVFNLLAFLLHSMLVLALGRTFWSWFFFQFCEVGGPVIYKRD